LLKLQSECYKLLAVSKPGVTNLFAIAGQFVSYRWVIGLHNFLVILWNLLVQDCWSRLNASCAARNSFAGRMFITPGLNDGIWFLL